MKTKSLNDELTIVGLILILLFVGYELFTYKAKVLEAQKAVIFLDNKLTKTETKLDTVSEQLVDTTESINQLAEDIQSYQYLEELKKDIDRNLWPKQ